MAYEYRDHIDHDNVQGEVNGVTIDGVEFYSIPYRGSGESDLVNGTWEVETDVAVSWNDDEIRDAVYLGRADIDSEGEVNRQDPRWAAIDADDWRWKINRKLELDGVPIDD